MTPDAPESLAARLKRLRLERGHTQLSLAEAAGLSRPAVTHIESGRRKRPGVETVRRLAEALGVGLSELAG
jgi:transcriptional regulator with XRE-family HTH domain